MMSLLLCSLMLSHPLEVPINDNFLEALSFVESSWDANARGDDGAAVGLFQIWEIYVDEANRILRAPVFSYDDRWDVEASREMVRVVVGHWARYLRKKGFKIGPAELCSIHRRPNHKWTPKNMECKLERDRTKKLIECLITLEQSKP